MTSPAILSIHFDDGYRSAYQNAMPILDRAGLKSSHYIITHTFNHPAYMTPAEILALEASGHEIGAHSQTHPHLDQLPPDQAKGEIFGSRQDLLDIGIRSVDTFVYPYGGFNPLVQSIVQKAGFAAARTILPGFNDASTDRYTLTCQCVDAPTTFPQVRQWVDSAVREGKWLILVFHRVDEDGNPISVRHELIQEAIDYLQEKKVRVLTTTQALTLL